MSYRVMICSMCSLYCYAYYIIACISQSDAFTFVYETLDYVSVNTGINSLMSGLWCISSLCLGKMSPYINHTIITTWYLGMEFIIWNIRIWQLSNKSLWKRRTGTPETKNDWYKHLPSRWPLTCDLAKCYFVQTFLAMCNLEIFVLLLKI